MTPLSRTLYFGWLAIGVFLIVLQHGNAASSAAVTIYLRDEYGRPASGQLTFFSDGKRDLATNFIGLHAQDVPLGIYNYVVRRVEGGRTVEDIAGRLEVLFPENLIVIRVQTSLVPGLTTDRAIPSDFVIRGRLEPTPESNTSKGPIWIRFSPLYRSEQLDVPVDASGQFRVYQPLEGRYLVSVIKGQDVLQIQQVSFEENWRPAQLVISLPASAPTVTHVRASDALHGR
jgi:hypothetical protein